MKRIVTCVAILVALVAHVYGDISQCYASSTSYKRKGDVCFENDSVRKCWLKYGCSSGECQERKVRIGEACDPLDIFGYCSSDDGLFCDERTSRCKWMESVGSTCSSNKDCEGVFTYLTCQSGQCRGVAEGEKCAQGEKFRECDFGLFCGDQGLCEKQKATGQSCTENKECQYSATNENMCISGVCRKVTSDGVCYRDSNFAGTDSCVAPMSCSADSLCKNPATDLGSQCYAPWQCDIYSNLTCSQSGSQSTCTNYQETPDCTSDKDCGANYRCNCLIGKCYARNPCAKHEEQLNLCTLQMCGCPYSISKFTNQETCEYKHCLAKLESFVECSNQEAKLNGIEELTLDYSENNNEQSEQFSSGSIAVASIMLFIPVLLNIW